MQKRAEIDRIEQARLNTPIQVFRVVDDVFQHTTTEASIKQPKDGAEFYKWEIAGIRPQDPEFTKLQNEPRYKCDYCSFKSIYPEITYNHMMHTKKPRHDAMSDASKLLSPQEMELWAKAFSRRGG